LIARRSASRLLRSLCLMFVLSTLALFPTKEAKAHPLGNFTINHYSSLEVSEEAARVTYVLDFAEIPTLQQKDRLDTDGDGVLSRREADAYLDARLPAFVKNLRLRVGDEVLPLRVRDRSAAYRTGQGGLPTLRVEAHLVAGLPKVWEGERAYYVDRNYSDRTGWREILVRGGPGVAIEDSTAPANGVSDELRSYPQDMISSPLDRREATFTLLEGDRTAARHAEGQVAGRVKTWDGNITGRVASLVSADRLSAAVIALSMLAAFFWGAAHALTPGHGKTIVAAYLIGARGTAGHAGILGLTVTLTHTAGVFALGAVTLYLSRYILPEALYPWLSVVSGLIVVAIGLSLLYRRVGGKHASDSEHHHAHHHDHVHWHGDHTHSHHVHGHLAPGADGSKATWRGLVALGVSGGLVPCPAALVLLLGAISLDRLGFGIVLVVAFSVGLAIVLTGVGLLMIYARKLFERFSFEAKAPRFLPVASALAISLVGMAVVFESLVRTGLI
jgi:nickel/cobalt transporter (NicO) family protein